MRIKKLSSALLTIIICLSTVTAVLAGDELEAVRQKLTFKTLSAEPINGVTGDFVLPLKYEGAYILWTSDNENVIAALGGESVLKAKVYRPPFGEGHVSATLTAHITLNDEMTTKRFLVRVLEQEIGFTYSETVLQAYHAFEMEFLSKQNIFAVTGDLVLPVVPMDSKIVMSFKSENPAVITDEGVVTRNFDKDETVVFTTTYKEDFETFKVSYPITVKAYTDEEIRNTVKRDLDEVINRLMNRYNCQALESDIQLPATGSGGTAIKWVSSDSAVITAGGRITRRDASGNAVLTATGTFHEAEETRTIDIRVERIIKGTAPAPSISGGGGGGTYIPPQDNEPPVITPPDSEISFADVSDTHYAREAIGYLARNEVINGIGDNLFAPDSPVTREQAVKIILLGLGIEIRDTGEEFADMEASAWYSPYIKTAKGLGIVNGLSETEFGIGKTITRQDLAVMLYSAAGKSGKNINKQQNVSFSDSDDIASYAREAVTALGEAGIINGRDGKFYPLDSATRAEMSVMLYRLLNQVG